jgi:hypothetical protein
LPPGTGWAVNLARNPRHAHPEGFRVAPGCSAPLCGGVKPPRFDIAAAPWLACFHIVSWRGVLSLQKQTREGNQLMTKPVYIAYAVKEYKVGEEKRSTWNRIGAAFVHKDGEGFEVILDALPVNGRVILRKPKSDEAEEN